MEQRLRQLLAKRQKVRITNPSRTHAAVLVPMFLKNEEWHLLFIKRTNLVRVHKGQISFPGGAYEERDGSLLNAALRESAEEIGLAVDDIQILGELDDQESITTNYVITPFLALIPHPYHFRLDGHEVQELLEVPISALLDKDNQHTEILPDKRVACSYRYGSEVIWGATARILKRLLNMLGETL